MNQDLDKQRICIVLCVNKPDLAEMTMESLGRLNIPDGFQVDVCTIEVEKNIAKAYNEAIRSSNAQYKLYLREGVEIENDDILIELIKLFKFDYKVGIVGLSGAEYIPVSCDINSTRKKYGKVYNKKEHEEVRWQDFDIKAKCVAALDNWFLATQYDIEWREDLFENIDYLGLAQCQEFKRNGYEALVMQQDKPWVSIDDFFRLAELKDEAGKAAYKEEYYKEVFPLVSVLIPTHNRPEYFKIALESAINQTYKNLDIVVSDNSDDDRTSRVIDPYIKKDKRIRYFYHKGASAETNNFILCDNIRGEYINWLMDDDYFSLNKIEAMIDYYREYDNVTLVTSRRQLIDASGKNLEEEIGIGIGETCIVDGDTAGYKLLESSCNYLGEPTTPLLKSSCLNKIGKKYGRRSEYEGVFFRPLVQWDLGTHKLYGMVDMMLYLNLLSKGDLIFINDKLSSFRLHAGQEQKQQHIMYIVLTVIGEYLALHKTFAINKFVHDEKTFFELLAKQYSKMENCLNIVKQDTPNIEEFITCMNFAKEELANKKIMDVFKLYDF